MKLCMIGLGSIGQRHIRNVSRLLQKRGQTYTIDALRVGKAALPQDVSRVIHKEYYSYTELPSDYDIIFVTNPTAKHYETIQAIALKTHAIFIEKPLFENSRYILSEMNLNPYGIYYVACPLRYTKEMQYVKDEIVAKEAIYAVRALSTSYLPEWRKNIDYRTTYSAHRELGGGVTLDLIHEWDYLTYLFGFPINIHTIHGTYSDLEIDSDDIAVYIAEYKDKTVEVHLDYIGRTQERTLELYCKDYRIDIDLLNHKINYKGIVEKEIDFEAEDCYETEMNYFLDIVAGKQDNINTIEHAEQVLQLILGKRERL
ncbi:MAG: Gfo/Idh/MocA family oxidoreductase [Lachnospiraceae bacterium]